MKLGIINGWDEGSFRYVSALGLEAVEFCCNHNYDSMEVAGHVDELRASARRLVLNVFCCHIYEC